ncbi:unnamed protein product [Vicia faba]|uniref:Uncharacterized protein n=1 Tax=Vicia faba TaxID=3906 RepID=A0AAV1ALL5_VICFA|nr:unnamed protein product [Vicia faba]
MKIHFIFLFFSLSFFHGFIATIGSKEITETQEYPFKLKTNPFSPKASLIRHWNTRISNNLPNSIPNFFLSKASPLTPQHYANLVNLLKQKPLSANFHNSLCSTPYLFCSFDHPNQYYQSKKNTKDDANFAVYSNKKFTAYGYLLKYVHTETQRILRSL